MDLDRAAVGGQQRGHAQRHRLVVLGQQQFPDLRRERGDDGQRDRQRVVRLGQLRPGGADELVGHLGGQLDVEADQEAHIFLVGFR